MIRTMIFKEFRDHVLWTMLGGLLMLAGVCYAFWEGSSGYKALDGLMEDAYQAVTGIGCPVLGLTIGLMLVLRENRRDRWAFLVHRPVTRTQIFVAKAFAGIALYAITTGVVLAGACLYAATPGRFAYPFVAGQILPSLADWLIGPAYLFAGLLVGIRQASWWKTRILPVGFAMLASVASVGGEEFSDAAVLTFLVTAVLACAAWGAFVTGGTYSRQAAVSKGALFLAVGTGLAMVGGLVVNLALLPWEKGPSYSYNIITRDGRVVTVEVVDGKDYRMTSPDGSPVTGLNPHEERIAPMIGMNLVPLGGEFGRYRSPTRYAISLGRIDTDSEWFYLPRERRFVGYNLATRRLTASAGPNGFVAAPQLADAFPADMQVHVFSPTSPIFTADSVYLFDWSARRVHLLGPPAPGQAIRAAAVFPVAGAPSRPAYVVVASDRSLYVYPYGKTEPIRTLQLVQPIDEYPTFNIAALRDGKSFIVLQQPAWWNERYWEQYSKPSYAYTYNEAGEIVATQVVPPLKLPEKSAAGRVESALSTLVPGIFVLIAFAWLPFSVDAASVQTAIADLPIVGPVVGGIVAGVIALLLARRNALSRRSWITWVIVNAFFGIPGLITMLAVRDWPGRVPCPACGKRRIVSGERCEHCGTGWPGPARDGTEVFEESNAISREFSLV